MRRIFFALALVFGLAAVAEAQTSLTNNMAWGASPSATEYLVERDTDGAGFVEVAVVAAPTLTYQDALLPLGPTYSWRVKARKQPSGLTSPPSPSCTSNSAVPVAPSSLSCGVTFQ